VGSAVVGGFGIGDGAEALIEERSGGLRIDVPVGSGGLSWSSASAGVDQVGFGPGWGVAGLGYVDVTGGVRVFPGSGGVFEADASVPSGLRNYVRDDLRFRVTSGVLPARVDGVVAERAYGFILEELSGSVSYFAEDGNPIARVNALGHRSDWEFDASGRLTGTVDADGVVTSWDWADPAGVRVTTGVGTGTELVFVVDVSRGFVSQVTDPVGGVTRFTSDRDLLTQVSGVSGAVTEVSWQTLPDGASAVDRVRVMDGTTGAELSAREWDAVSGTASGYPAYRSQGELFSSGDPGYRYSTVVSDGHSRVVSEYNSLHLLIARGLEVDTPAGPLVVQEQNLTYPDTGEGGVPPQWDLPEQYALPTDTAVLFDADAPSGGRTVQAGFVFDTFGRETSRTAPDGTTTTTVYDDVVPPGKTIPIGLPVLTTTTAPDGLTSQNRYELNDLRTAVIVEETFTGSTTATDPDTGEVAWTRTSRSEHDVRGDGFVTAERAFPQGGTGTPVTTVFDRVVDHAAGTVAVSQTVAVGTGAEQAVYGTSSLITDQTLTQTDPAGNITVAGYDRAGRQVSVTDPTGHTVSTQYRTHQADGVNQVLTTTPDGVTETETRDVLGRVVEVTDNIQDGIPVDGHVRVVETRAYPVPGVTEVTDAYGNTSSTRQDVLGREVETVAPTGVTKITRYDDTANTVTTGLTPTGDLTDAEITTTRRRDERDQVVEIAGTRKDAVAVLTESAVFDGFGRVTTASDGIIDTTVVFDEFSNAEITTLAPVSTPPEGMGVADLGAGDGTPITATRQFDQHGTSVQKTLSSGEQARSGGSRVLDERGRTLSETAPDGTVTAVTYTVDDLVETVTTSYGQHTHNTYHPVTRSLEETVTTSPVGDTVATGFVYEKTTGAVVGVFDPTDRDGTEVRYTYDVFGNTLSMRYPDGKQISHMYDPHGRLVSTTDVAGNTTVYEYDTTGFPVAVVQTDAGGGEVARVGYVYDDYGRVILLTRGNGVETAYTYTSASRVAAEVTTKGGEPQETRDYAYNPAGQLVSRTDTIHDGHTGAPGSTHTVYTYDAHNRLTASTLHGGVGTTAPVSQHTGYTVTVSGDINTEQVTTRPGTPEETTTMREFTYGPNGALTTITTTYPDGTTTTAVQEYDPAGNLTQTADGSQYTYNASNRQTTETTPTGDRIATEYWATGQRATLSTTDEEGEKVTEFYWDGTTLTNDTHTVTGRNPDTASYLLGAAGTRHTRTTTGNGDTDYYTHDRHSNTVTLTGPDGVPTVRYTYSDYGTPTISTPPDPGRAGVGDVGYQPFGYAGEYTNPTGTQHLQAREYNPATLRFTTPDTAPLHNVYAYGNLNPITMVDPTGRTAEWDTILNGLMIGFGLVFAVLSAVALAGPTAGASLGILATISVGLAADLAATGIAAARIIDDKVVDFINDTDSTRLGYAELGVGIAGIVTGTTGFILLGRHLHKTSKALKAGSSVKENGIELPDAFELAAELYKDDWKAMAAWRTSHTSEGHTKTYFHYTNKFAQGSIREDGFDVTKRGADLYGTGGYFARREVDAKNIYGAHGLRVQPVLKTAAKLDSTTTGYLIRNPFYRKHGARSTLPKNLSHDVISRTKLKTYATDNQLDALFIDERQFLILTDESRSGSLPLENIDSVSDQPPAWGTLY
jgi:RHS repeat-associated protein